MHIPITSFKEIHWPAIPSMISSTKLALQYQLDESQWWTAENLKRYQFKQFKLVLEHALNTVPFYQELYSSISEPIDAEISEEYFSSLPFISRSQVQQANDMLVSTNIPASHGKVYEKSTSGSTGASLKVKDTEMGNVFFHAHTLRDHFWHQRDFTKKLAAIRLTHTDETQPPNGKQYSVWGASNHDLYPSGPSVVLSIQSTIDEQWRWLKQQNPEYLITYPSALKGLLEKSRLEGNPLTKLREVSTLAEIVSDELRESVQQCWNVPLHDMYTSQEIGYMALQCPDHTHYHVQSESMIMEVLNEQNLACQAGEIGRVVITTLHNFVSPLIRYEIGDYAQVGEPCSCGRGLPVLKRIMGRERNLVCLPDGTKRWVWVGENLYGDLHSIQQFQMIQYSIEEIEIRLVCEPVLSESQKKSLIDTLQETMAYPFKFKFNYVDNIPRSKGGKFEDFISYVK